MRIGINLLPYHYGGQGGAEVFVRNLLLALAEAPGNHDYVLFVNSRGKRDYRPGNQFRYLEIPTGGGNQVVRSLLEQLVLPYHEQRLRLDLLFSNYVLPVLHGRCARLVTIYDMLYDRYPEFLPFSKRWWWRLAIPATAKRCDLILTTSNASKADIVSTFSIPQAKVMVQSAGVDLRLQECTPDNESIRQTLERFGIKQPYILSAATFGPQKNVPRFLEAFQLVRQNTPDLTLVLTGRTGRFPESISKDLLAGVAFTNYVSTEDLANLYASALLHVLPSVLEGFGLSILEAQYFGCPVATSNLGATAEVAGLSAALFDPWDTADIARVIASLVESPSERVRLRESGRQNLRRYSWRLAAEQFLQACQLAVENHRRS